MGLLKKIRGSAVKTCAAAVATIGLATAAFADGSKNTAEEAYNAWLESGIASSQNYEPDTNSFTTSTRVQLDYPSFISRDNLTLNTDFGPGYTIGNLFWDTGENQYSINDIINSLENGQISFGNLSPQEDLENLTNTLSQGADEVTDYIGQIDPQNITEQDLEGLTNILDSNLNSFGETANETLTNYWNNLKIGGIPIQDVLEITGEIYDFLNPTIEENALKINKEVNAHATANVSTYSEQTFKSKENDNRNVSFSRGTVVDGQFNFHSHAKLDARITNGPTLEDVIGELDANIPPELDSMWQEILETKLPRFTAEGSYKYSLEMNYKIQENNKIKLPINDRLRLSIGLLKEASYCQKNTTHGETSADTNPLIIPSENDAFSILNGQTEEERITNSETPYLALRKNGKIFGYSALGLKTTEEQRRTNQQSTRTSMTDSLNSRTEEVDTQKTYTEEKEEVLWESMTGINLHLGKFGIISPYVSRRYNQEISAGFFYDSKLLNLHISDSKIRGIASLCGSGNFGEWYKAQAFSNPTFVMKNDSEIKNATRQQFLNSNGIFLTYDADKNFQNPKIGLRASKKGKISSYFAVAPGDVNKYYLGLDSKIFSVEAEYGVGQASDRNIETYGLTAGANTGPVNFSLGLGLDKKDDFSAPHENLEVKAQLSVTF